MAEHFSTWDYSEDPFPAPDSKIHYIDHFDARGMRRVYARGDNWPGKARMIIDVWLTKSGRLISRFWSRSSDVDGMSLGVLGFSPDLLLPDKFVVPDERWVPQCVRDEYDQWVISEG